MGSRRKELRDVFIDVFIIVCFEVPHKNCVESWESMAQRPLRWKKYLVFFNFSINVLGSKIQRCDSHNAYKCSGHCGNISCMTHFQSKEDLLKHIEQSHALYSPCQVVSIFDLWDRKGNILANPSFPGHGSKPQEMYCLFKDKRQFPLQ